MRIATDTVRGVSLGVMDLVKIGTTLVTVAAAFFALSGKVDQLGAQAGETRKAIERQDHQIERVTDDVRKVSNSSDLLHEDFRRLGHLLYEKHVIKSPEISYPAAAAHPFELPPETAGQTEETPERKHNPVMRALKAAGHAVAKAVRGPERETP